MKWELRDWPYQNLQEALIEAGYDNAGKLVLTSKINPDTLLEITGIGPKTLERIIEFAEELPNLVPQVEEEVIAEEQKAEDVQSEEISADVISEPALEAIDIDESISTSEETPISEVSEEPILEVVEEQPAPDKELSFDEIFSLKPEVFEPAK